MSGYDPSRSKTNPDVLANFIKAPLTGDLQEVPGIGPKTVELLEGEKISTTFALLGKFLMLKEAGVESVEHCDRFWYWLESIGTPAGYRGAIVQAVANKLDASYPGMYDASKY